MTAPVVLFTAIETSQSSPGFLSLNPPEKSELPSGLIVTLTFPSSLCNLQLITMGLVGGAGGGVVACVVSEGAGVPVVGVPACAFARLAINTVTARTARRERSLMAAMCLVIVAPWCFLSDFVDKQLMGKVRCN